VDQNLTIYGLVRFRDVIYVLENNELKNCILRSSKILEDFDSYEEFLLLAKYEERGGSVHLKVLGLLRSKSRVQSSRWFIAADFDSRMEMGGHFHEFHYR